MKTIDIQSWMSGLPAGTPYRLQGLDSTGNVIRVVPSEVLKAASDTTGRISNGNINIFNRKWHRIAMGRPTPYFNSALVNIGHNYNTSNEESNLFYLAFSNKGVNKAIRLDTGLDTAFVTKIRCLYKSTNIDNLLVDIYIDYGDNIVRNQIDISYSCNINFTFQQLVEVSDTPDEGYRVKEFTFE